jgi:hypothetical protein
MVFAGFLSAQDDPHTCSYKMWLGKTAEIESIIERRDGRLEYLDERIKDKGEALVLFN